MWTRSERASYSRAAAFSDSGDSGPLPVADQQESTEAGASGRAAPWDLSKPNMRLPSLSGAPLFRTAARSIQILFHALGYFIYTGFVYLTVRDPDRRQKLKAVRLRHSMQSLGGMLVKVGQQLALRMDIIPKVYCDEFQKLLDGAAPFDFDLALAAIEKQVGVSWQEVFEYIRAQPIGSASIACVYEARLRSGEKVAIKVRRPNILRMFATDFRALAWTVTLVEFLTLVRQGVLKNFQTELHDIFREELDFRIEARYQELFRRYLKRRKKLCVTAPRVFHRFTGPEVMVSDFVTGVTVKDIRDAILERNRPFLTYLEALDIKPKRIAKRLIRASYYTFYECPFFHGDPHPANIFIQPGGKIVMVDFGACGVFSRKDRAWMWQLQEYYQRGDVAGMVQCVIGIMEPLPLVNIDAFKGDLQLAWWHGYYGIQSKHSEWWERTSFRLWLALLDLFRKYQLPMPLNLLRMIRATLLYDTVAAQLHPKINVFKEFEKYFAGVARKSRERMQQAIICQALTGPSDSNWFRIEQAIETGKDLLFTVQQFLRDPQFNFLLVANKFYHALDTLLDFFSTSLITALVIGFVALVIRATGHPLDWPWQWPCSIKGPLLALWALYIFLYSRRVLARFRDPDNYNQRRRSSG